MTLRDCLKSFRTPNFRVPARTRTRKAIVSAIIRGYLQFEFWTVAEAAGGRSDVGGKSRGVIAAGTHPAFRLVKNWGFGRNTPAVGNRTTTP